MGRDALSAKVRTPKSGKLFRSKVLCSTRLVTLYQTIHDALHAKSGQAGGPVKLQLIRTDNECVMGWVSLPTACYEPSDETYVYLDHAAV
jgi:hypothetical protein